MKIEYTNREYNCTDGCCYEWWTDVYVDGVELNEALQNPYPKRYASLTDAIEDLFLFVGIDAKVEYLIEEEE